MRVPWYARTIGTVTHAGRPATISLIRLVQVPPVLENWTLSMATMTSARLTLSKKPSQGKKLGWWIATSRRSGKLVPHNSHHQYVHVATIYVGCLAECALPLETCLLVRVDRTLVVSENVKEDSVQIQVMEPVTEQ